MRVMAVYLAGHGLFDVAGCPGKSRSNCVSLLAHSKVGRKENLMDVVVIIFLTVLHAGWGLWVSTQPAFTDEKSKKEY